MKHTLFTMALVISWLSIFSQTNNFPTSGNVGVGTTNPSFKLDVNGSHHASGKSWFSYGNQNMAGYSWVDAALNTNSIEIVNSSGPNANLAATLAFHNYGTGGPQLRLAADGSNVLFLESSGFNSARSTLPYGGGPNSYFSRLHVDGGLTTAGNVGIGTLNPSEKLAVNGKIRAKEIKVENTNWPDFVFTKSYTLPTLMETEAHIKEKGHLPGIPSADEVKANGIDLGEMNAKLLQKIEELTLHLIEKEKSEKSLQAKVETIEGKLNMLLRNTKR